MCHLPPKKSHIEEKKPNNFFDANSKKVTFVKFCVKKSQCGNPGEPRRPALSFSFADLWMTTTIPALLK